VAIQRETSDADEEVSGLDPSGIMVDSENLYLKGAVEDLVLSPFN